MDIFSNILDPIRDSLDPDVFDDASGLTPRLKATIASWVKNKVYSVLQANGYKDMDEWLSLILTGSLTTYQWAEDSDFDVSLWCSLDNFEEFDRAAFIAIVLEQLDGHIVPGTTHPLQVFVVDVTQVKGYNDAYQPGVRSAYDLDKMEWMVPPERDRVHDVKKEYPDVFNSALQAASKMRSLLQYQPESARAYWKYLHKRRRSDMKAGRGDYADSNIVYKMLHNAGLFDTIQKELGVHIAKAVLAESNMVDVEDIPADQDPLAAAAGNTLVGPSIAPKARPSGQVRKSHDEDENGNPLEPHVHFEDLEHQFGEHEPNDPLAGLERDLADDATIRDLEGQLGNQPAGNEEDAEAKYDAFAQDDQNIPHPASMQETKAHFKKHHGMDIEMFKQMMGPQFAQMTGGYDLEANPDIEEEIFDRMHKEIHNPESPYAAFMKWNHDHPEDGGLTAIGHKGTKPHIHFDDLENEMDADHENNCEWTDCDHIKTNYKVPVDRSADDWELFEDEEDLMGRERAAQKINQGINGVIAKEPSLLHAFEKGQKVLDKFADYGASDTEGQNALYRLLHEYYEPESPEDRLQCGRKKCPCSTDSNFQTIYEYEQDEDGDLTAFGKVAQMQPLDSQMEWLDLVLDHGLSVDQIPSDLHTHPTELDEKDIPAHVLKEHGYIPNTSELGAAHKALHDGRRMHWLYNNLSTQDDSN